jgi:hypothetical protein
MVIAGDSVCPIPEVHGEEEEEADNSENIFSNYYGYYIPPEESWYEDTTTMQFAVIYMSAVALTAGAMIGVALVYGGIL